MTPNDALFRARVCVLATARELGNVRAACRLHGLHPSTYCRWRKQVEGYGLEILRPRERCRPRMPNSVPLVVEGRVVAFSLDQPGFGPARIAAELSRPKCGRDSALKQRSLAHPAPLSCARSHRESGVRPQSGASSRLCRSFWRSPGRRTRSWPPFRPPNSAGRTSCGSTSIPACVDR